VGRMLARMLAQTRLQPSPGGPAMRPPIRTGLTTAPAQKPRPGRNLTGILSFRKLQRIPVYSTNAGGIITGRRRANIRPRSGSVRSAPALRVPTLGVGAFFLRAPHMEWDMLSARETIAAMCFLGGMLFGMVIMAYLADQPSSDEQIVRDACLAHGGTMVACDA
jgi:hypothetical protein